MGGVAQGRKSCRNLTNTVDLDHHFYRVTRHVKGMYLLTNP